MTETDAESSPERSSPERSSPEAVAERALALAGAPGPDPAGELVALAGGHRLPLEEARRVLGDRLHRRPDDFAATGALVVVGDALSRIGWAAPLLGGPPPPARPSRRSRRAERRS